MYKQDIKAVLGNNIKFFRFHRQYSQADLAEKANVSITYLSSIERGLQYPKPDILLRIAESLEIEVYELFKPNLTTDTTPNDSKKLLNRFSQDITRNVIQAMEGVVKQYLN